MEAKLRRWVGATVHLWAGGKLPRVIADRSIPLIKPPRPLRLEDQLGRDYEVDLYLRQKWHDERLQHPDITEVLDLNDPNLVKAIWKPEVYFPNAKHAEFQFVTVPNVLIRINPDGEILYMLRLVANDKDLVVAGIAKQLVSAFLPSGYYEGISCFLYSTTK
ncbi:unnamed protein product [Nezara viridula]|uniref:Neurotransmitter-gated ion-channel ligand-binding domain-containing protein n=1 Tax=Nezara viridula TaxID=85310 RepID=A0A9P0MWK5_NEZVI|nr:unnamed protein product [Nezara viridula]